MFEIAIMKQEIRTLKYLRLYSVSVTIIQNSDFLSFVTVITSKVLESEKAAVGLVFSLCSAIIDSNSSPKGRRK